jgi:hypothetical protein
MKYIVNMRNIEGDDRKWFRQQKESAMTTDLLNDATAFFGFINGFGVVRGAVELALLFGLWRGLARTGFDLRTRRMTWLAVAVPLLAWWGGIWRLAVAGVFDSPAPALIPLAIAVPLAIGSFLLMRSQRIAAVLDATPPSWLVALQVYRIVGATFLVQWSLGHLPGAFALPAGIGDMLTGAFAIPAALRLSTGTRSGRTAAVTWNLFGILDLVVAVTLGGLSRLGLLHGLGVATVSLSYPLIMIPVFTVPQSLILHGLSLWQLRRAARRESLSGGSMPSDVGAALSMA